MKIVAADNVVYAREAFSTLGHVEVVPAKQLDRAAVADADILVIRSTNKAGEELLSGSRVTFVGSAVIGTDHMDMEWMDRQGILYASAPGCNANSVSEYVTAALLEPGLRRGRELAGRSIGVVGVGNVGSRVVAKAGALGMHVVQNDPPLARQTGEERFRPVKEVKQCDFISLHTPLTKDGPDATWHMVNEEWLAGVKPGAVLINAARGAVVDQAAMLDAVRSGRLSALALDVFEGEPDISPEPVEAADIATPHVAGHSFDGKVIGTAIVYEAACRMLGRVPSIDLRAIMPAPPVPEVTVTGAGCVEEVLRRTIKAVYDIMADDASLRRDVARFSDLRRDYPVRREFHNTALKFDRCPDGAREKLLALGFRDNSIRMAKEDR